MPDLTDAIPVLWFDAKGCGPDELALELRPFPAEKVMGGVIPAVLGVRVRAGDLVIGAAPLVDGGFNLGREQAAELHRQLGAWLEANPWPSVTAVRTPTVERAPMSDADPGAHGGRYIEPFDRGSR